MRALVSTLLCLSLALPLRPEAAGFYFREEEGWFWYEREPDPAPAPKLPLPEQPPVPAEPQVSETAPEGQKPLSAQWIREHIGAYRDAAIDDPTPQNVALYLYLQRVALDKSSRFAAATQRAVQLDPFLDSNLEGGEILERRAAVVEYRVGEGQVIARHRRCFDREQTFYDWQHYLPVLDRKPGALRNGARTFVRLSVEDGRRR